MQYEDYFPPADCPNRPVYSLDEFWHTQFDKAEIDALMQFLRDVVLTDAPMQLKVESRNSNEYAGQRGLFYLLAMSLGHFGVEVSHFEPGIYNVASEDYKIDSKGNFRRRKGCKVKTLTLYSKLVLTPNNMMDTEHFTRMVRLWSRTLVSRIESLL